MFARFSSTQRSAFLSLLLSFTLVPAHASGAADTNVVLRLKWLHQAQFAGYYAAQQTGLYKSAGLNVDIRPGGVDFPAIQMVAAGSEDFGVTGADQILLAREKGVPVVAVAVIYRDTPFVLFALKKSGIHSMADLKGKKVGVKLGGNEELTYRAMLAAAKVDSASLSEMPVKFDISPLLTGQIDVWPGYVINEVLTAREQGADVTILAPKDYGINFYADTLFTTEKMIQEHPDTVAKFVKATLAGWSYAVQHPDKAASFGLKYSPQLALPHEVAMMKASIPLLRPQEQPLGEMSSKEWQSLEAKLLATGSLKEKIDLQAAYTDRFITPSH